MESYKNDEWESLGLVLEVRLNSNICIKYFNTISGLANQRDFVYENLKFVSMEKENEYWKQFNENINKGINIKVCDEDEDENVKIDDLIYMEMLELIQEFEKNDWVWIIRDGDLILPDGTEIDIIDTYGENSEEAKKYGVIFDE